MKESIVIALAVFIFSAHAEESKKVDVTESQPYITHKNSLNQTQITDKSSDEYKAKVRAILLQPPVRANKKPASKMSR